MKAAVYVTLNSYLRKMATVWAYKAVTDDLGQIEMIVKDYASVAEITRYMLKMDSYIDGYYYEVPEGYLVVCEVVSPTAALKTHWN